MQFISSICHLTRARACPALVELPSVAIMPWSGVHRGFVVRTFFENNQSIVATQRAFRLHFNIPRHGLIPDSKTIRRWIKAIEAILPRNLEELKMHIQDEIAAIPPEMCRRAAENFRHRLQMCIDTAGHHLPDVIFKT